MQTTETFGDDGSGPPTPPRDKAREVSENYIKIFPIVPSCILIFYAIGCHKPRQIQGELVVV